MKKVVPLRDAIAKIRPRQFLKLESVTPCGTLVLRKTGKGALVFYWRVTIGGKSAAYQIGLYDSSAPPLSKAPTTNGYSQRAAHVAAEDMAETHYAALSQGGYEAIVAQRKADEVVRREVAVAATLTLNKLFDLYVASLALRNAETAKQARNLFAKNVLNAFPLTANMPAREVTSEHVATILRNVLKDGKRTTARKLKAYLRAAFAMARDAANNPTVSEEFKAFGVKQNPVADVAGIRSGSGVDKNALQPDEMREYWRLISGPGPQAAFLRLHLLLGGQRIEQLVKLRRADEKDAVLELRDTKGRTGTARSIVVPLIPAASAALTELQLMSAPESGEFAISVTPAKPLSTTTARAWAKSVVDGNLDNFELKRVRSGVTTLLSKLKVNAEVRNHLQSHNLHGVEMRHYNSYDFLDEKTDALTKMHNYLTAGD
ncbi:tyrosine-type recombinase/integrase [Pandoraea bronchicola]|uniref:Phage integrase central domain-containing protein n=1 Tax=Pandoraea bronchicola TaxID=2508287 RepID=A0A5E5BSN5_9BURK|nr:hypothetical protein [Pandoraea bronchicola]VVE88152.1 hypothetical protein PBR20603_02101 [Pandoraea bronchicola]